MYASNIFAKRRLSSWVERRRHFERLFEGARPKASNPDETARAKAGKTRS